MDDAPLPRINGMFSYTAPVDEFRLIELASMDILRSRSS